MRLRRFIAILLMTLANTLILAHIVLPHYHHDGIVCFKSEIESICEDHDAIEHKKSCTEQNSEDHTQLEDCDLHNLLKRIEKSGVEEFSPDQTDVNHFITVCTSCLYDHLAICASLVNKDRHYIFFSDNYISPFVGSHYGLRAPPVLLYC